MLATVTHDRTRAPRARLDTLPRRRLLAMAATAGIVRLAPRGAAAQATPAAGGWTFTDDLGQTVALPQTPTRVFADLSAATALWDFGFAPVAVSGWMTGTDDAWGNLDRALPVVNSATGAPDPGPEQLLALDADLFVTVSSANPDNPYEWSFPQIETLERVRQVVPVVAISATGRADENVLRFAELAQALGAAVNTPDLVAAKRDYDRAIDDLRTVAAEQRDLKVLFVSAAADALYVANPSASADLALFQALGLNVVVPERTEDGYWEMLSPEQALKYPADIVFQALSGALPIEELKAHPTYGQMPAVKAGQVSTRNLDVVQSYQGMADSISELLPTLRAAKDVTP